MTVSYVVFRIGCGVKVGDQTQMLAVNVWELTSIGTLIIIGEVITKPILTMLSSLSMATI